MAGRIKRRRTLSLLILLSLTRLFEVREEWEELRPDVAGRHRLRGLSEHRLQERLKNPSDQRDTSIHGARVKRSSSRVDIDQRLQGHLQQCEEGFTSGYTQMQQHVDEQKIQDRPISASEISHSSSQTLLVMTDKDKPAEDRVQQEYSMDPHYSVIVSKDCLFNVSCVPEADSGTVVDIFGRVSEDGQTVSVLETKQENHQIYQVMNQPDSVSLYQTPVYHSTQYDHQQILIMQDDPTVRKAATSLYEKRPTVTSVYALDKKQRPKLIHGASVPLSEDSRLTLVGHGERDNSGETRLAGYTAQDVAKIIQQTFRTGDRIKTTSVVACEVGSDKEFVETLLRELHETANIETELHLRNAVLQVRHTGEIITQEISEEGVQWRHNDDSKKVVATLDRNGDVIIRNEPGRRGEEVFTNERNFLAPTKKDKQKSGDKEATSNTIVTDKPKLRPHRFIDQNVFEKLTPTEQTAVNELEALSWAFFHADLPLPDKVILDINQNYVIGKKKVDNNKQLVGIEWITNELELNNVLSKCYNIKTARDVRRIIRHYAEKGENDFTYLMVTNWIYVVNPVNLYVYPVGKWLDQNQRDAETRKKVKTLIVGQTDRVDYTNLRGQIKKTKYANYVKDIFLGEPTFLQLDEAAYTTYFTASVISESARNFRTFPLILMAVEMVENTDERGKDFLYTEHSMATGGSWINMKLRGFSGAATPEDSSKSTASSSTKSSLEKVIEREVKLYNLWIVGKVLDAEKVGKIADNFELTEGDPVENYNDFKNEMNKSSGASASG